MLVKINAAALQGIDAIPVTVECAYDIKGFDYTIVGLPDTAVKESHQRISAALK